MRLEHQFSVPAPLTEVWPALLDPERVAPCMPGATLTSVDGDTFTGNVKVKLGPVSLTYKGTAHYVTRDETAHQVVIKASGKDTHGNGTAAATITVTLTESPGTTTAQVHTDLAITGKPAQFGRGLITEVGNRILTTFATCLAEKLGTPPQAGDASPTEGAAATNPAAQGPTPEDQSTGGPPLGGSEASDLATASPGADDPSGPSGTSGSSGADGANGAASRAATNSDHSPSNSTGTTDTNGRQPHSSTRPTLTAVPNTPTPPEPIDLMEVAGRSLAKRAVPTALALALIGAVVAVVLRKRS
ncbi:SRPBCC domain-containing protein [Actinokineospora sp. NPDC004072]